MPQPTTPPSSTLPTVSGRVLLAEDGVHNQRAITYYLRAAGAEVDIAENGKLACSMATAAAESLKPYDVILMDMQMPEMDGYEATTFLRSRGYTGAIVALTAHAMSQDRDRCLSVGCTDYITKPIDRRRLIETVAGYLRAGPIRSTIGGEPEVVDLIQRFVEALPGLVGRMTKLIEDGNIHELDEAIHQLKGSAGTYGFMPITEAAARVESLIDAAAAFDAVAAEAKRLAEVIRTVEGYKPVNETSVK